VNSATRFVSASSAPISDQVSEDMVLVGVVLDPTVERGLADACTSVRDQLEILGRRTTEIPKRRAVSPRRSATHKGSVQGPSQPASLARLGAFAGGGKLSPLRVAAAR